MVDAFDERDLAAADALDVEIDRVLAGAPGAAADRVVTWLTVATRSDPPPAVATRVEADHRRLEQRRWRPVQVAAAALAALLLSQGIGNLVTGEWVARGIGEHYSPHAFREGGFALLAAGIAVAAGVFRRSWLPVSASAGVPLGVALGLHGASEVGQFTAGAVLHLSQGAIAVLLGVAWWRARRYG